MMAIPEFPGSCCFGKKTMPWTGVWFSNRKQFLAISLWITRET